jgi:opacity protein-like surface antigen
MNLDQHGMENNMTKHWKSVIALVAVATAITAADASAQVRLSASGGPSFPVGDLSDVVDTGFNVNVGAGLGFPLIPVGVRLEGSLNQFPESGHDGNFRVISGSANAVLDIPMLAATPYLIGGLGVYNSRFTDDDDHDHDEGSTTNVGANIGAGVRLGLPFLSVFAEARLHNIFSDDGSARFVPVSLGIRF